ncbi:hypothetical protein F751_6762 [Auxenochlorella protothecoides]|uniref:BRCT domain-containing protein n=1 Tax=Auxenochlorella protothecoides TaxID=3075 RepID=A0A087SDJ0_AUXPR|nr:hypothetical protein F751_6762 [Auxenochlorella protothecoides]KFM23794.1 hypothetical protein F751_6762 [Auxenochlorella protothecoides]
MTICLSGLGSSEKQDLVQLVEAHNGRHSAALDRRCTHLVTCTTQSDKYSLCMDACYLWLVGCGPQEQLQALQAIRRVAAKRFAAPHPLLTHVIVGGALSDTDARRVAAVASGNASLQVVCLDWLLDCVKKGCILACRPYHFRAPPGARGGAGAIAMIFHESTVHTVPSREVAYALCPASLTHAQVKALCSASSDFTYVPEDHRVTSYWMECSLLAGKLVPHSRGAPCYRPLPYPFPLPGVEKLRICISGYDVHVRSAINFSVQLVGGTHSSEAMTRANTHLVLPEAVGEKYKHCAAFGVTPVTADWLVDSITAGLLQPEKEYHPGRRAAAQPPLAHQSQAGGRPRQGQSQEQCGAGEGRASQASRKRAGEGAPADLGPLNLESLLEMTEGGAGHREKAGPPPKRCVLGGHGRSRLPRAGSGE